MTLTNFLNLIVYSLCKTENIMTNNSIGLEDKIIRMKVINKKMLTSLSIRLKELKYGYDKIFR